MKQAKNLEEGFTLIQVLFLIQVKMKPEVKFITIKKEIYVYSVNLVNLKIKNYCTLL